MFVQARTHKIACEAEGTLSHIPSLGSRKKVGARFTLRIRVIEQEIGNTLHSRSGISDENLSVLRTKQWVLVTKAWRVLRLRIEERPPIRRVAANKLNKQSRTADEG